MLKRLAILGLFLGVLQAPSPMPGQAVKPAAQSGDKGQNQGQGNENAAAHSLVLIEKPENPATSKPNGEAVASEDEKQQETTITVGSLPQISLAKKYPTVLQYIYDWGPWAFTLALVIVGYYQVRLLKLTLQRVSRQADIANRQAVIMAHQVEEMRKVSEIENRTLILQYRPRIVVRHARAKEFSKEISEGVFSEPVRCVVAFQIVNIGGSPAHIVNGDIYILSARLGSLEEEIEFTESTHVGIGQRTLQPGEREAIEFGLDTRIPNDARWVEFYKGASSHSIFLLGEIWYRDELGIPRQTGLHRKYDPKTKGFIPQKDNEEEYSD